MLTLTKEKCLPVRRRVWVHCYEQALNLVQDQFGSSIYIRVDTRVWGLVHDQHWDPVFNQIYNQVHVNREQVMNTPWPISINQS